jgi:hypothetical protein
MKKLFMLLAVCCTLFLVFGCSDTPRITNPSSDTADLGPLVQRPEFVDTRPAATIESFMVKPTDNNFVAFKPPKPPPDTGGGADPNPNPAHKYAYIVGISDYEGTANDLQYCDDDAQEMKTYYQSQGFTIRMDLDRNATAANMQAGFEWLVAMAVPGDEIAFAYSGHGAKYNPYGSCLISTDLYYITNAFVMQYINGANCTKKNITIDACQAGSFLSAGANGEVIATASNTTYSYDAPTLQNGAWTYYWLDGVNNAGKIYAEDAASYAEAGMKAWASANHVKVSPAHTDLYTGSLDM